ncbi:MAG: hypothetical protein WBQ34_07335 [Candidatus Acidiferrales bacterium]
MNYDKPQINLAGPAIRAVQNPEASKLYPMFQDNLAGQPASYGSQAAYAADE